MTHDAPDRLYVSDAIRDMLDHNPQGWSPRTLEYARHGRDRLTIAFEGVAPLIHFHGHYDLKDSRVGIQIPGAEHTTTSVSLNMEELDGSLASLDLNDPSWDWL